MKHTRIFSTNNDIKHALITQALIKPYIVLYGDSSDYVLDIDSKDPLNGYTYVNLGLSSGTLWATCNVGASSPEDYGGYFAWAEVSEKSGEGAYNGNWNDYRYGTYDNFTKYNGTDNRTFLDLTDDAARVIMGGLWRIPTDAQVRELRALSSVWTSLNGVNGRLFTGNNGNTLFIPAAGFKNTGELIDAGTTCYMWNCEGGGSEGPSGAGYFKFDAGGTDEDIKAVGE